MISKAYCMLCCLVLFWVSGLTAQEKAEEKGNVVVTEKVEFIYDASKLK